ncbi:MAG: AraC family transcriptional regulator [Flavobacterium sp.]
MLYQMLFEMATGNGTFRIKETRQQEELDEIENTLNEVSNKMQNIILQSGYVNPHYTYQNLTQTIFVLNDEFHIASFSAAVPAILGFNPETLFKMEFSNIISCQSTPIWNSIKDEIRNDENFHTTIQLIFLNNQELLVPSFCTISKLLYSDKILISSITTILQDITTNTNNASPRKSEAVIIQKVYEYILNHLEEPLPTAKELSQMFGTNDFKLKDGFKHFFNTSIYKFYTEERLKKAHILIRQTTIPLKEIAFMSGFNEYTNFSKAFKRQYYYPPSDLKRENDETDLTTF